VPPGHATDLPHKRSHGLTAAIVLLALAVLGVAAALVLSRKPAAPTVTTGAKKPVATVAPRVTAQPANTTRTAGQSASFAAAASGIPAPPVQWRVSQDGGATWQPISSATADTLVLPAVTSSQDGDEYDATFTDAAGTVTTNAAILTVNTPSRGATPTGRSGSTTTLFRGDDYTIDIPTGWTQVSDETYLDPYFESRWERPGTSGVYLLVDHTPGYNGTALSGAAPVYNAVSRVSGYQQISYTPETLAGGEAQRWQFILNGVEKLDVFMVGCDAGYAVLGAAPVSEWSTFAQLFEQAADSLEPSAC
jgi:hypothetical protein